MPDQYILRPSAHAEGAWIIELWDDDLTTFDLIAFDGPHAEALAKEYLRLKNLLTGS